MIASSVRREKRRALLDKMAAQVILQGYIDSR
jgi:RNase H-fold protein (predicted Holliday junction resolvase)